MVKKSPKKTKKKTKEKVKKKVKTKEKPKSEDKEVLRILEGSTKFKTDVSMVVLRFDPNFAAQFFGSIAEDIKRGKVLQIAQGTSAIVMLCEEGFANKIEKDYKEHVIKREKDLVAFTVLFPKRAMKTPGILSFITNLFAREKINIFDIIGGYTDITFVINRKDLFRTMDLLGVFII